MSAAPGRPKPRRVPVEQLRALLASRDELALCDVREHGVHSRGHPFFAVSLPLSRLELRAGDLVPRCGVAIVLVDDRDDGLAERAAGKLAEIGYTDVAVLAGGCQGWQAAGGELFSGVNVPSKAFGEVVEHDCETPRVPAAEVRALQEAGAKLLILDSRPLAEYRRMNIPGALNAPGAELVLRVHDLLPDPDTMVVVNCAGRTRSIIGCQSLRNAGIANRVVALKDGTMGWELAGYECEHGAARVAAMPSKEGLAKAQAAVRRVAARDGVRFASRLQVQDWRRDAQRTLYLLDVRSPEEFHAHRIADSKNAPGGQLVQATDEYIGVRNSRIVLVDPLRVRSVMTASWLGQMGWDDVHVLEPEGGDGFEGWTTRQGPQAPADLRPAVPRAAGSSPTAQGAGVQTVAAQAFDPAAVTVLDLATSLHFRKRHIPGAWWAVRARLDEAHAQLAGVRELVLTCEDATLAGLAAPEAAALWPHARVRVLEGGNAAWFAAGLPAESGLSRLTTTPDDIWYKPYDHGADVERHARDYLAWEVALTEQIRREPGIRFRVAARR